MANSLSPASPKLVLPESICTAPNGNLGAGQPVPESQTKLATH